MNPLKKDTPHGLSRDALQAAAIIADRNLQRVLATPNAKLEDLLRKLEKVEHQATRWH